MILVLISVLSVVLLMEMACIFLFIRSGESQKPHTNAYKPVALPSVSILIAARNEAVNIGSCLASLEQVDYPRGKLEVLVGDDDSEDETAKIVREFAKGKKHIRLIPITKRHEGLIAKGNVLHQLAEVSEGAHLVFLDADMKVSHDWLQSLLAPVSEGHALVSGYTEVVSRGWFSGFQQLEWAKALFFMKVMADLGKPLTVLGNNMLVTKAAYEKAGGFEATGATLVEDFRLMQLALKHHSRAHQLVTGQGKALTKPVNTLRQWLNQRKRWISVLFKLSPTKWMMILFQRLYIILCFWLMALDIEWGIFFLVVKMAFGVVIPLLMKKRSGLSVKVIGVLIHEILSGLLNLVVLFHHAFSGKQVWKGRKY